MAVQDLDLGRYKLGWSDAEDYVFKPKRGLDEDILREMSWMKGEPDWMLQYRLDQGLPLLRAPAHAERGAGTCLEIDFDDIYYYIKPIDKSGRASLGPAPRRR